MTHIRVNKTGSFLHQSRAVYRASGIQVSCHIDASFALRANLKNGASQIRHRELAAGDGGPTLQQPTWKCKEIGME